MSELVKKHSGLGIASFVVGIVSGLLLLTVFVIAGIAETSTPGGIDEKSPIAVLIGLLLFLFLGVALVGLVLGVAGLLQKDREKIFAILGVIFSAIAILCPILLVLVGLALDG
jgi:uncharacterized membrane protein